jgi:hypothetical protein
MFAKSPLYLSFSKSGYTFRYSLPKDVRSKFGRREMKVALKTYDFATARRHARSLANTTEKIVTDIRNGGTMAALTNSQIKEYLKRYVLNDLKSDECRRAKKWKERTELELSTTFDLLKRILGDVPIKKVAREDIATFKTTLMKLPPNISKIRAYRNKTIPELIEYVRKKTFLCFLWSRWTRT